jgi:lysophospholipid acyltransferase (LPLAT)-like uncharacterized protein
MIKTLLPIAASALAKTLRVTWKGAALPESSVVMFWHGKMFAGWSIMRSLDPVAMVSASKDGAYLASVLDRWGYQCVRGSTKKKGVEALEMAIGLVRLKKAKTIVVTPDGPRGPRHKFHRGAFVAAKELGLPLYLVDIRYGASKKLKSWDVFEVPMPFSRVTATVYPIRLNNFPNTAAEQYVWIDREVATGKIPEEAMRG